MEALGTESYWSARQSKGEKAEQAEKAGEWRNEVR